MHRTISKAESQQRQGAPELSMQDLLTDYLLFSTGIYDKDGSPWDHVCVTTRYVALPFANGRRPGGVLPGLDDDVVDDG